MPKKTTTAPATPPNSTEEWLGKERRNRFGAAFALIPISDDGQVDVDHLLAAVRAVREGAAERGEEVFRIGLKLDGEEQVLRIVGETLRGATRAARGARARWRAAQEQEQEQPNA